MYNAYPFGSFAFAGKLEAFVIFVKVMVVRPALMEMPAAAVPVGTPNWR